METAKMVVFYLALCGECAITVPFGGDEEALRDQWVDEHNDATGHEVTKRTDWRPATVGSVEDKLALMGKAAPPAVRLTPLSLTVEDEAQHPAWPAVDPDGVAADGCETVRAAYDRTRCCAPGCGRCWPDCAVLTVVIQR